VYGVCRTFPIRVNNRGGYSGPCYVDQEEINWKDVGVEPELTTVTKLPRRIFTFSEMQIRDAVRMNGVDQVFLNFANYCFDAGYGLDDIIAKIEKYAPVSWLGYGPSITDVLPGRNNV
jgi:adenylosuccinate synthase